MAGRGPAPKDPSKLAGHGAAKTRRDGMKVYQGGPVVQPDLPDSVDWPEVTREWWRTWGDEPMSQDFRRTDWDFLADTALIHSRVWGEGDLRMLPELRLRVAKMGATAEDRARLRITYAAADEADGKRVRPSGGSARERRGPLKIV